MKTLYNEFKLIISKTILISLAFISSSWKVTFIYDNKGNKIEENLYETNVSISYKLTFKYDNEGNKIEENVYNEYGELDEKQTYKYDKEANLIENKVYNAEGGLKKNKTFKYEFDKKGNWIQIIEFENKTPIQITERIIDYF